MSWMFVCVYTMQPEDLRNNLPVLLNQDYPDYEIIVVNDGSDANSEDVLKLFSNEYSSRRKRKIIGGV